MIKQLSVLGNNRMDITIVCFAFIEFESDLTCMQLPCKKLKRTELVGTFCRKFKQIRELIIVQLNCRSKNPKSKIIRDSNLIWIGRASAGISLHVDQQLINQPTIRRLISGFGILLRRRSRYNTFAELHNLSQIVGSTQSLNQLISKEHNPPNDIGRSLMTAMEKLEAFALFEG